MFLDIIEINVNDGFIFSDLELDQLSLRDKKYPGYRIIALGKLGQIQSKITIDIGFGDIVRPKLLDLELLRSKKPLFEDYIQLSAYPVEYIFSEKLEAIISLGELTSRMKDYYDCYQMILEDVLNPKELRKALTDTFNQRETEFSLISAAFEEALRVRWNGFVKKQGIKKLAFKDVIAIINDYLAKIR